MSKSFLNGGIALLLLLFSTLALIVPDLSNACLFLLVLCGAASLLMPASPQALPRAVVWRRYWPLLLALALPALAVLLHQVGAGDYNGRDYDRPLRLAMFLFVFLAVRRLPAGRLDWLPWAWTLAAVLACGKAWIVTDGGSIPNTGSLGFVPGVVFSNVALLLGVWLLLSLRLGQSRWLLVCKLIGIVAACYVTFMIKTRGTWLALPFFAVFFVWYLRSLKAWQKAAILLIPLVLLGAGAMRSDAVGERLAGVRNDLTAYADGGNRDTSVGQRLEIWRASWLMFREQPLWGVGRQQFKPELYRLAGEGKVSASIVELPHAHNGLMFQMALWGSGGLIAWMLVYLAPMVYFARALRHADDVVRTWAAMGMCLCIGFMVFDMTDVMFFWVILNGFYAISLAIFLTAIDHRKAALPADPSGV
ncbi:O-antigen ligase family protein [Herbaspirillum sp. LeCh32-8]|uniref:O-antigen ligase family protein n=1 Tax=Herbaspirillum sp. LeCh32-8 TaxID=2821356 RepID=UPI001AEB5006|nr:O-antigen ligase family protein [Herbaspirillum sp. LeCh32-8]MBP0597667.1 O-antigen ligase family protein [Herbaspirillum sp. LeCh32-8]